MAERPPEYIERLVKLLKVYDTHIKHCEKVAADIKLRGGAESLNAWEQAKNYIIVFFPEVKPYYRHAVLERLQNQGR